MNETEWDVVVLGAGAAGLMAGARSAELGVKTLVLEKNKRPGVKILMSGGTRCNITHDTDERGIVAAYGDPGKFLHSALAALSVRETIELFEAEGVPTKVEETGKIFPVSNKAADVLDALLKRLHRCGASLSLDEPAHELEATDDGFLVSTSRRRLTVSRLIVTTGGQSYPGSGTRGDGYRFARQFGHTIVPTRPALAPITSSADWVRSLSGLTLQDVVLTIHDGGQLLTKRRSSMLFAHFGLTGPAALDASRFVSGHTDPARLRLTLDLLPNIAASELDQRLQQAAVTVGKKNLATVLAEFIPHRLADVVLRLAAFPADRKIAGLSKVDRTQLASQLKSLPIPITGTMGFEKAEVTAGGVTLSEVRSKTMESLLQPGLYWAGEVLDLDGPIGGFNFQAAWSTGWLAGQSAANAILSRRQH